MVGFEPTTFGTTIRRSNQLNYNLRVRLGLQIYYYLESGQFIFRAEQIFRLLPTDDTQKRDLVCLT